VELILEAVITCEESEDFRTVCVICCVCVGEGHPYWSTHFQHVNNVAARDTYKETGDRARLAASLLADGDKGIEIVYGEEKKVLYFAD
jgi:hypothetical protein